eukprot:TRINITY_DN18088_c0_g1_i1.p2 TRINITY_DN18088_c0_g1~~TRINITY_DN18088_c0_g1_i1.p2  ORF type:complete len:217 (-),score=-49.51 TRINITY_DN18088_c0_g1_i1:199-849(-)
MPHIKQNNSALQYSKKLQKKINKRLQNQLNKIRGRDFYEQLLRLNYKYQKNTCNFIVQKQQNAATKLTSKEACIMNTNTSTFIYYKQTKQTMLQNQKKSATEREKIQQNNINQQGPCSKKRILFQNTVRGFNQQPIVLFKSKTIPTDTITHWVKLIQNTVDICSCSLQTTLRYKVCRFYTIISQCRINAADFFFTANNKQAQNTQYITNMCRSYSK